MQPNACYPPDLLVGGGTFAMKICRKGLHKYTQTYGSSRGCPQCRIDRKREWRKTPKGRESRRREVRNPEVSRRAWLKWSRSEKGKAAIAEYENRPEVRLRKMQYKTFWNLHQAIAREERWLDARVQEQVRD